MNAPREIEELISKLEREGVVKVMNRDLLAYLLADYIDGSIQATRQLLADYRYRYGALS